MLRVGPEQALSRAIDAGVRFFQYRNKSGPRRSIYETSLRLVRLTRSAGALFVVNDHADIAAAIEADGVHLGQDDLPIEYARKLLGKNKLIGVSTHSPDQAEAAERGGADYIGFGPLFPTSTKDAGPSQGTRNLSVVKQTVLIPVIAIGGINRTNAQDVMRAGADGVAVISAVLSAPDIKQAAEEMLKIIRGPEAKILNTN